MNSAEIPDMPWLKCAATREALSHVESILLDSVRCEEPTVFDVCCHLLRARGKRLRPTLVLLIECLLRPGDFRQLKTAAAMELIHLASLYHDDVLDEAIVRRHVASANAKWGNLVAVFAGTYLFSRAFALLASCHDEADKILAEAVRRISAGQKLEIENAYNLGMNEDLYFTVIEQKTATLYELACRLAAISTCASQDQMQLLVQYGRNLGIAFQLVDDVIDITGDERRVGRKAGTDLREGVYTLPVLYSVRPNKPGRHELRSLLGGPGISADQVENALNILRSNGSIEYSLSIAETFLEAAKQHIAMFPDGPPKHSLLLMCDYVINRASFHEG